MFVSRDDFLRLGSIRGLETVLDRLLGSLAVILSQRGPVDDSVGRTIAEMRQTAAGLDTMDRDEKRERILELTFRLQTLRLLLGDAGLKDEHSDVERRLERLSRSIRFVRGVGPKIASLLARKNVHTIEDLLYFLPRAYEDRRTMKKIAQLRLGEKETVMGRVKTAGMKRYGGRRTFEITISDGSGWLRATWFSGNQAYLTSTFQTGSMVVLSGEVRLFGGMFTIVHPDFEIVEGDEDQSLHFHRIVPIYSETEGLHQRTIRRIIRRVLDEYVTMVPDALPAATKKKRQLPVLAESIEACHFPPQTADAAPFLSGSSLWHRHLAYDECFFFQLGLALKKKSGSLEKGIAFRADGGLLRAFFSRLPFPLTGAQQRVIEEIRRDMERPYPMNRLLQGDVGSGKTVVAVAAMLIACDSGYQAAIMTPTEILAEQHYRNIRPWMEGLGIETSLLTGAVRGRERRAVLDGISIGRIKIVVGTHALIQEEVRFNSLGLAVIDEQHRFGVLQRADLRAKGYHPDILVMTATPIPRTLAMTVYGDLDLSIIDEHPPGKKPVKTKVFFDAQRERVYEIIRGELKKRRQVFIVYPLVSESENLDLKDATTMAEHLRVDVFPEAQIGLIHGKMKPVDKNAVMETFREGKLDILVATTVVEVGIDVPTASLMVVEHAERFGLSQLHQLRGRVGRGDVPAYCILLVHGKTTMDARRRLKVMEKSSDGFRIAEEDLLIRGPGEFMGTKQSGLPDFRVVDIIRDEKVLVMARQDAFAVVEGDPRLERPEHRALKAVLLHRWSGRLELAKIA